MQIAFVKKKKSSFFYTIIFLVAFFGAFLINIPSRNLSVTFSAHSVNAGWLDTNEKSAIIDTSKTNSKDIPMSINALKINLKGDYNGGVSYNIHVTDGNWLDWKEDGKVQNANANESFNAIKIKLYGSIAKEYNIKYKIQTSDHKWSDWYTNGELAGNSSSDLYIINIKIELEAIPNALEALANLVNTSDTSFEDSDNNDDSSNSESLDSLLKTDNSNNTSSFSPAKPLVKPLKGIDVSSYNSNIDWKKVKDSGVQYAIIKVGYRGNVQGILKPDQNFDTNIKGAINVGLPIGVYYVTQANNKTEAIEEANYVLSKLSNYTIQYPIYIDIEDVKDSRTRGQTKAERTAICKAFCDTIQNAGYRAGIYSCQHYYEVNLDMSVLKDYAIWLASYDVNERPKMNFEYGMWQCSETGSVSGINTRVDINYCYYDYVNATQGTSLSPTSTPMNENTSETSIPAKN